MEEERALSASWGMWLSPLSRRHVWMLLIWEMDEEMKGGRREMEEWEG